MSSRTLSQDVNKLTRHIVSKDIQFDDIHGHTSIYKHLEKCILPKADPETDFVPLPILGYAVRALILPDVIIEQIPDLLKLLAHIEGLRQQFSLRLDELLEQDATLNPERDPISAPFTLNERIDLRKYKSFVGKKLRKPYREIMNGLCLLYIYEQLGQHWKPDTRKLEDSAIEWDGQSEDEFMRLFMTYFPVESLRQEDIPGVDDHPYFHWKLSGEEREELEATCEVFLEIMDQINDDKPPQLTPEEFRARYPCPEQADPKRLTRLTLDYVNQIEAAVERVEVILATVED